MSAQRARANGRCHSPLSGKEGGRELVKGGRSKRGLRRRYAHYPQGLLVIFSGSMGNKCKSHSRVSPWPMAEPVPDARVAAADAGQKN